MTTATNLPTHLVYHVEEGAGDAPSNWTKLGAMWPHKDGNGWNMQLQFMPINSDGKLTIRVYEPKQEKQAA